MRILFPQSAGRPAINVVFHVYEICHCLAESRDWVPENTLGSEYCDSRFIRNRDLERINRECAVFWSLCVFWTQSLFVPNLWFPQGSDRSNCKVGHWPHPSSALGARYYLSYPHGSYSSYDHQKAILLWCYSPTPTCIRIEW